MAVSIPTRTRGLSIQLLGGIFEMAVIYCPMTLGGILPLKISAIKSKQKPFIFIQQDLLA